MRNNVFALVMILCAPVISEALQAADRTDGVTRLALPSGVVVEIVEAAFADATFKVVGCKGEGGPCLINGLVPFGSDYGIPRTYVKSIKTTYGGRSHLLDVSGMYNAWGKRPLEYKGTIRYFGGSCSDRDNCHFRGLFSDGAGAFVAEWHVVDGMASRTVLTDSSDIIELFRRNIDPPDFE